MTQKLTQTFLDYMRGIAELAELAELDAQEVGAELTKMCDQSMDTVLIVLSPVCAVAGYLFKLYVDKFTDHKLLLREKKIEDLEYKLKEFYFPFYTNLKTEKIVGSAFVDRKSDVVFKLEEFVLNAHLENQAIIKTHMVAVNPDKALQAALTAYSDYITVYKLMQDHSPETGVLGIAVKFPYPKTLFSLIETELNVLRLELDALHNSLV